MPNEWLGQVSGGDGPEFQSQEQAQLVFGAIMGRYNAILDSLAHEPEDFEPILYENRQTGRLTELHWCLPFTVDTE